MKRHIQPLDFVKVKSSHINGVNRDSDGVWTPHVVKHTELQMAQIGIVTEGCGRYSISWIGEYTGLHNAWWDEDELILVDSLPRILANNLAHPSGCHTHQGDDIFGCEIKTPTE